MLKRLKIKFVIVVMSVVTVLFGAIFGFVMHFTKQNIERQSIRMMQTMAFRPPQGSPRRPVKAPDDIRLPVFIVSTSDDGTYTASDSGYYDLTDDVVNDLMEAVNKSSRQTDVLSGYDLRFLRSERDSSVIFADVSREKAMISDLIRNSLIIGLIGYAVFFVISLLLAEWVTKPVAKAWGEQKQFIADASHELKTPLTVIMTNAEMLGDKSYTESDKDSFAGNILSASKRMKGLVEDLLELARLDSGRAPINMQACDLSSIVNNCIMAFEPLFFENGLELCSDIDGDMTVKGDKENLRQVMDILLDNALKYSDSTEKVSVALKTHGSHCTLSVSGKGDAISKDDCRNIFKRFYRIDQARNDSQSYGLGLPIAESIIKEHGGRIWAESADGRNTFYVQLDKTQVVS
ncbi:MAG: HAMP domain-containing histidine kinase [Oscillospiraceae bacterium]|nr:HAMP domain-containing histidine kinase [Oscillospiraceae bacterium]